jgi:hypothetical protein
MKTIKLLTILTLASFLTSCGGSAVGLGGGAESMASVQVKSTDLAKAQRVVREVFAEEGFQETSATSNTIFFTKEGNNTAQLLWGGWGDEVMINPEVLVMRANGGIRLDCDLYITNVSESFGEGDSRKPWVAGHSAYRKVLKRIKKRIEN